MQKVSQKSTSGMRDSEMSYNDLIKWLEKYLGSKAGAKTYRGLEYSREFQADVERARAGGIEFALDPMLPIDLVMVESKQEPTEEDPSKHEEVHYYTLFWYVSSDDTLTERRLQFYRFYLSRIFPLRAVEVIMVVPANISGESKEQLQKTADENSFGLWSIDASQKQPEELCKAKSFLEHMGDKFTNPPSDMESFEDVVKEKAPQIALFFDRYVREAVEALAGVSPMNIGKRYIERELLDKVFELQNISYADELRRLITKHLVEKGNDYDFVMSAFSTLWKACGLGMEYSNFLKVFEPPLYNIFAEQEKPYRDHYLHQFQVFLLGLSIIDKIKGRFPNEVDKLWLITSSCHDMAYPLQLYDKWAQEFFKESLNIPEVGVSDMKSSFIDGSLLSSLGYIVNALCKSHFGTELIGNWLQAERPLVLFFHNIITGRKHHCVLSSLFLLKQAQSCAPTLTDSLFVPSALAIALHHDVVWKELPQERQLKSLKFDNDPLTFLLMFCDCAQEWGRPKVSSGPTMGELERFVLQECEASSSSCTITLRAPYLTTTHPVFRAKQKELESLEAFLQSPADLPFKIILKDKSGSKKEHPMTGPST